MRSTEYLIVAFALLFCLVRAAPTPSPVDLSETIDYLVARTRTTAKKQLSEKKRIVKQLDQKLSPPRNGAVFWSGRVNGGSAISPAMSHAKKTGKMTLEMGLKKAKVTIPKKSPHTPALWDHASKLWAQRSKGKTEAFLGQVRPQSVYNRIEKPDLAKNKKVTKHTEHHLVKSTPKASAVKKGKKAHKPAAPRKSTRKGAPQRAKKPHAKNTHKDKKRAKQAPKKSKARSNGGTKAKAGKAKRK